MNIIERVKELNLPHGQYVVFGSGPLAVHGIRETNDVDLLVTTELYNQLKEQGWEEKEWELGGTYLCKGIYEVDNSWSYGDYDPGPEEIITIAEMHDGIPFAPLTEVIKWKHAFGRPKDLEDIELIQAYHRERVTDV